MPLAILKLMIGEVIQGICRKKALVRFLMLDLDRENCKPAYTVYINTTISRPLLITVSLVN